MELTIRFLGLELLNVNVTTDAPADSDNGDVTTSPISFAGYTTDARWQPGAEL